MIETQGQMKISDAQIETMNTTKKKLVLTKTELNALPEQTKLYESVGRM